MKWRLLESGFADAATNMAVDHALLLAQEGGSVPPTLRLYGWRPPSISVGYFQRVEGHIDVEECRRRALGFVRRPTGGRAILHDDEVTYAVVIQRALLPCAEGVMSSYRYLSRGIEAGLRLLGVPARLAEGRPEARGVVGPHSDAACFAKAAPCDISLDGRKIVGSAQTRSAKAVLQHGSVPLSLDLETLFAVIPPADRSRRTGFYAVSVSEALGRRVGFDEVSRALVEGFQEALGVTFEPGELTPFERDLAARLKREKYARDEWNLGLAGREIAVT